VVDTSTYAVRTWRFPRIDVWPVNGEGCPTASEFGPLMGAQPVADEALALPKRVATQSASVPEFAKPRMVRWLRPAYPLEWARTEMEGTVRLGLRIPPTGEPDEIEVERSSGSQQLDATAAEAAKSWRFAPASWRGQPIVSKATVELTFNFFEYRDSRIDDEVSAGAPGKNLERTVRRDRSEVVHALVEQRRRGTAAESFTPANADGSASWPTAMRDWGPVAGIQYLGTLGDPEWRRYHVNPKFRAVGHANSVAVRWDLYRIVHDNHAALWLVALDRRGGVWALKAESLDTSERANKSAPVCPGDNLSQD
jgi:TonB family protein